MQAEVFDRGPIEQVVKTSIHTPPSTLRALFQRKIRSLSHATMKRTLSFAGFGIKSPQLAGAGYSETSGCCRTLCLSKGVFSGADRDHVRQCPISRSALTRGFLILTKRKLKRINGYYPNVTNFAIDTFSAFAYAGPRRSAVCYFVSKPSRLSPQSESKNIK